MANAIRTGNFPANSLMISHPFSIFNAPYMDAANMSSYNKTELDLLQSEGIGIPKEMIKSLQKIDSVTLILLTIYVTSLTTGMVFSKSVLVTSP
jgi:hypothetical protein